MSQRLIVAVTGFIPNDKNLFEDCVVKIAAGMKVMLTTKASKQAMECEDGRAPYEWEGESILSFPGSLKFSLTGRADKVELFGDINIGRHVDGIKIPMRALSRRIRRDG